MSALADALVAAQSRAVAALGKQYVGEPYSKERQLARGERRYRRKVASPKQWQAIIAAKRGTCRCLRPSSLCHGPTDFHHLVSRAHGGDDVADNIVPVCRHHHLCLTAYWPDVLQTLAESLSPSERAYVVGKLGADGIVRLFGATR